jgi:hypothetical protein
MPLSPVIGGVPLRHDAAIRDSQQFGRSVALLTTWPELPKLIQDQAGHVHKLRAYALPD